MANATCSIGRSGLAIGHSLYYSQELPAIIVPSVHIVPLLDKQSIVNWMQSDVSLDLTAFEKKKFPNFQNVDPLSVKLHKNFFQLLCYMHCTGDAKYTFSCIYIRIPHATSRTFSIRSLDWEFGSNVRQCYPLSYCPLAAWGPLTLIEELLVQNRPK